MKRAKTSIQWLSAAVILITASLPPSQVTCPQENQERKERNKLPKNPSINDNISSKMMIHSCQRRTSLSSARAPSIRIRGLRRCFCNHQHHNNTRIHSIIEQYPRRPKSTLTARSWAWVISAIRITPVLQMRTPTQWSGEARTKTRHRRYTCRINV